MKSWHGRFPRISWASHLGFTACLVRCCGAFVRHDMRVTKEAFREWEKEVIDSFYDGRERHTSLIPTIGTPSVLSKEKYILVVDAIHSASSSPMSESVRLAQEPVLASKCKVSLWHLKRQALEEVNFGLDKETGQFHHPACDLGGLTNLRQQLGSTASFVSDAESSFEWPSSVHTAAALASTLERTWSQLLGKKPPGNLPEVLRKWLESVAAAFPAGCQLRFHPLPKEHRVLVTPEDVKARTGRYYLRTFGGDAYAVDADDTTGLYCGVAQSFVTSNLSDFNVQFEYTQYHDTRACRCTVL